MLLRQPRHDVVVDVIVRIDTDGAHEIFGELCKSMSPEELDGRAKGEYQEAYGDHQRDIEAQNIQKKFGDDRVPRDEGFENVDRQLGETWSRGAVAFHRQ